VPSEMPFRADPDTIARLRREHKSRSWW